MTQTIDRLKILPGNSAFPRGGTCKICGFPNIISPKTQKEWEEVPRAVFPQANFRFSDVCGSHDCRVKANVCDCKACQNMKVVSSD